MDDIGLYNGMKYLRRSHIVGKVQACVVLFFSLRPRELTYKSLQLCAVRWLRDDLAGAWTRNSHSVSLPGRD